MYDPSGLVSVLIADPFGAIATTEAMFTPAAPIITWPVRVAVALRNAAVGYRIEMPAMSSSASGSTV